MHSEDDGGSASSGFAMSMQPDGLPGPMPVVDDATAIPAMSPANCPCLRGPCRYFMHGRDAMEVGNTRGTFVEGREPTEGFSFCTFTRGNPLPIEANAYPRLCNRWDPEDPTDAEVIAREARRSRYFELHPEHQPISEDELRMMIADDGDSDTSERDETPNDEGAAT